MYVVMYSTTKKELPIYYMYKQKEKSSLICERDIFQAGDSFLFGGVLARVSSTNEPTMLLSLMAKFFFYFIFQRKASKLHCEQCSL